MKILVVEDDKKLARFLSRVLTEEGYVVDSAGNGTEAIQQAESGVYDLIVLDWMLPETDGLQVCRELRRTGCSAPVLMLTARGETRERVLGLDAGADDYMVKPFDLDELTARMRSALRRAAGRGDPLIRHGDIRLDPVTHSVHYKDAPVVLSAHEYAVLEALLQRPGAVLSRAQLEDRLYGWDQPIGSNAVEVYIHGLRRKLGSDVIRTLRGVGYFVPKP